MSREHLTNDELTAYARRALAPDELLAASDHLVECAECRERLDRAPAPDVLPNETSWSYDDLVGHLEGALDPLRQKEMGDLLARSPRARAELDDLLRFRAEMNRRPARDAGSEPNDKIVAFPVMRWMLPLAAGLVLAGAALWWNASSSPDNILVLNDGGRRLEVRANGRVPALANLGETLQRDISTAIRNGTLPIPPEITALAGNREALAGEATAPNSFRADSPIGTAVRDGQPHFNWTARPGATGYRVTIAANGNAITTAETNATTWSPNESLTPGATYQWQVEALRGREVIDRAPKPPQPEARFQILSAAVRAEVEQAEADAAHSHLAKAVIDARAGLLGDARRELSILIGQNPDLPTLRQWLAQLGEPQSSPKTTNGAQ